MEKRKDRMRGKALQGRIAMEEAHRVYVESLEREEETVARALEQCFLLQVKIGALPAPQMGGNRAREMARLCDDLAEAKRRLRDAAREYPRRVMEAERAYRTKLVKEVLGEHGGI